MAVDQAQSMLSQREVARNGDDEEQRIICQAVAGDRDAVDWLINRYRVRAVRLAMHILRQSGEAEDAAQEAFIRAFRDLNNYRNDGKFYTWLFRIVVRVCLDRKRLARWTAETNRDLTNDSVAATDGAYAEVELRIVVDKLLEQMAPTMRATLVLREIEGLEYAEIAQVLRIPVGRVKWRLHTARRQFEALWNRERRETDNV